MNAATKRLLIATLACCILLYAFNAFNSIPHVSKLNPYEHTMLGFTKWASEGRSIYTSDVAMKPPFAHPIYPPVFYYVAAVPLKLLGVSFSAGRIVSFVSALLAALFIFGIVRKKTGSPTAGFVAAGVFLCFRPVFYWSSFNRVDTLGIMFITAGLWCYFRFEDKRFAWLACVPLFVLGLFTKQTLVAAIAALCISELFRKPSRAFITGGLTLALGGIIFLAANACTHGGFFMHVVETNRFGTVGEFAVERIKYFIFEGLVILCMGLAFFGAVSGGALSFETIFFCIAAAIGFGTVGYPGGDMNYFLETCVAMALIAGIEFGKAEKEPRAAAMLSALLIVFALWSCAIKAQNVAELAHARRAPDPVAAEAARIAGMFPPAEPVLYQDTQMPLLMRREPAVFSTHEFKMLLGKGFYKKDFIRDSIEKKEWKAVILTGDITDPPAQADGMWFNQEQLEAIRDNYIAAPEINKPGRLYSIFIPR